jgi:hypothetical protein
MATPKRMPWRYHDGGRKAAGYTGATGDCVCRAIAIATGRSYAHVYASLNELEAMTTRRRLTKGSARTGVNKDVIRKYLTAAGWVFTPTMGIGTGCKVHLAPGELPVGGGPMIVSVSRHLTCVINGVIYDTHDPQRDPLPIFGGERVRDKDGQWRNPIVAIQGGRCVYGYWRPGPAADHVALML